MLTVRLLSNQKAVLAQQGNGCLLHHREQGAGGNVPASVAAGGIDAAPPLPAYNG